jgi:AcrR family transcriptional regulator
MLIFWERDFDATSTTELAVSMGISPASLYAAFGNEEHLFLEAVALYESSESQEARRAMDEAPTARAAVPALLHVSIDRFTDRNTPRGCMIVLVPLQRTFALL